LEKPFRYFGQLDPRHRCISERRQQVHMGKLFCTVLALATTNRQLGATATTYQVPMDVLAWISGHFEPGNNGLAQRVLSMRRQ
jgi:hypothetical protein